MIAPQTAAPFLQFDGLRKTFGDIVAIDRVDLSVSQGEFLTFLGPSGSGKSTTLYVLAGFQDPTRGDIRLQGQSVLATPSHKRNLGMVFQRYTLFPHLSVAENIAFPLRVRRLGQAEIKRRVGEALELVRLTGMGARSPAKLSGGQQQRVALARALVYAPPVLLMDEPLSALDRKLRDEIQTEIRRIHRETGVTIIYVTHDQEEALRMSDRIAVFNAGRIEQIGTGTQIYTNPTTRFVADFVGDSAFLTGQISHVSGNLVDMAFPGGISLGGLPLHGAAGPGQSAELMLRPERLDLRSEAPPDGAALPVTVEDSVFLGSATTVDLRTAWGEAVSARLGFGHPMVARLQPGLRCWVSWEAGSAHVFPCATQSQNLPD